MRHPHVVAIAGRYRSTTSATIGSSSTTSIRSMLAIVLPDAAQVLTNVEKLCNQWGRVVNDSKRAAGQHLSWSACTIWQHTAAQRVSMTVIAPFYQCPPAA